MLGVLVLRASVHLVLGRDTSGKMAAGESSVCPSTTRRKKLLAALLGDDADTPPCMLPKLSGCPIA